MFVRSGRFVLMALVLLGANRAQAQFVNGSFETGSLDGWLTADLDNPLTALDVSSTGANIEFGSFETAPTDGSWFALTGFDGDGPGTIFLAQDVTVPAGSSTLKFDYRAAWDLDLIPAEIDRSFAVVIEPEGGGEPLQSTEVIRAIAGEAVNDTGLTTASLDLSAFAGQAVRVKFAWDVPEEDSGPAACVLDNVRLVGKKLPAGSAATLRTRLDFVNFDMDTLSFSMVVPVSEEFEPLDSDVGVTVGDASFGLTLDEHGNAVDENVKINVRPAGPGSAKVTLKVVHGDVQGDLSDYGLENTSTGPAGVFCSVPVSVDLDGTLTERSVSVVYKAVEDLKGAAAGKIASELRAGKLLAQLDFTMPGMDTLTLKGFGVVEPGFSAEGATATVSLGPLVREFELDASGHGETEDFSLALKRDKKEPSLYAVTLVCAAGDLAAELEEAGFTNATVAKPGADLPLVLTITLDGRVMQTFLVAKWIATQDDFGLAHAKF